MRKILAFLVLLMLPWVARGQSLSNWYYWFDMDDKPHESGVITDQKFQIEADVSHLNKGLHSMFVQVRDTAGVYSVPRCKWFYNLPENENNSLKFRYWFAGDTEASSIQEYQEGMFVDVTRLKEGFNTIFFLMGDNDSSEIQSYNFIKIPQTENAGDMTLVCIIDGKVVGEEKVSAHGGVVKCDMDVSNMEVGLHKAMFQLITPSGVGSSIAETYFIRTLTNEDVASMQCSYAIDGFKQYVQKGTLTNGTFHFDLPIDEVEDGLHRIDFMLVAENGATTTQGNAWFFKTPIGGNGIKQYDYWLNDKSDEVQSVLLDERKDPFQLIKLLSIPSEPVRSSCFHFENKDNSPIVYAKNDIHFRFHDKSGRWVDADKRYIDYNTSTAVTDIAELQSTQTFVRPEENGIKWFEFEGAPGDTIAFKASQATSIQVFAPSGKEIFSALGDKSVQYSGAHIWEDGTYYAAVHDVTGTKPNITLDYIHMDKYDVVSQDVRVVGNGGCSTITFQGNGFKDLYAVDLKNSEGNIIASANVGHESDSKTSVRFNFTNAPIGKYNAVFHFTEDDKVIKSLVDVEEAKEIGINLEASYASTFLRGTSNTYNIRITNTGNSTAYQVPLKLQLQADGGIKDITSIKMSDNIPILIPSFMDEDSVPQNIKEEISQFIDSYDGMLHFMKFRDNSGVEFMEGYFALDLPPNSTYELSISVKSNSRVILYTHIPSSWYFYAYNDNVEHNARRVLRRSDFRDNACCSRDHVECIVDVVVNGLDFASLGFPNLSLASCLASLGNTVFKTSYDIWCGEAPNKDALGTGSFISGLVATVASCLPDRLDPQKWAAAYRFFYDIFSTGISCATTLNPDITPEFKCPPDPPKRHPSTPVNSFDPNDIYGYIAPSGSMYVGDEVLNMPYRIEFENDTTFATSAAHKVVVKDTLDVKIFDLNSYQPTSIKIGDKSVQLKGDKEFVTTVDMRPAINAIAQVEGLYDEKKGIATWQFTSLDPMTMEPTDDIMQGFLPVNYDGSGIGEVAYNINRKLGLYDGTDISNKASIVFDSNDAIETPVWTNIIDGVPPTAHVSDLEQVNDTIVRVHFDGDDNRSGIWKYSLYVQYGKDTSWNEVAEMDSTSYDFRFYKDIDYGFCVLATDSAGNVEKKIIEREYSFLNGEATMIDAVTVPREKHSVTNRAYDLSGRLIQEAGYRGIIIKNRKKFLKR